MDQPRRTYLVTAVDEESAVVRDVDSGGVHTVVDHPDLEQGEVVEGTLEEAADHGLTWTLATVGDRWTPRVTVTDLEPTRRTREAVEDRPAGTLERLERAGEGTVHAISVDPGSATGGAREVAEDEATRERAARLGAVTVEIRYDDDAGVLAVRYLPD